MITIAPIIEPIVTACQYYNTLFISMYFINVVVWYWQKFGFYRNAEHQAVIGVKLHQQNSGGFKLAMVSNTEHVHTNLDNTYASD